ncbi:Eco57I restriction-modification methylase domain-containing protein [Stenotrophomonas sp. LGBM10]|uniref:Eco57I restriction-modification methylase domain-containing protein n=1 Tax=Stenotrophomonas sp. LGBM10 TaxID=3390038 RepID=UPI00398B7689
MSRRTAALEFDAIHIEGGLLPAEWLGNIAVLKAAHQSPADYGIPKGLNLRDELGRYWRIAQAHWSEFDTARARADNPHALATRFVQALLREVFGATDLQPQAEPQVISERQYPIAAIAREGRLPLVVAAAGQRLDERDRRYGDNNRQRSTFGLLQDWLNASDTALWGIASNGLQLRLARDNASLTRPAWIEADLERIFSEERYADFSLLWLLVHASRFGNPGNLPQQCPLEAWREGSKEQGTRARDQLRQGVEEALSALGQGFLAEAANQPLRDALASGRLDRNFYFLQLLRLVYRLIFLLTIEERGLLHPADANGDAVKLYADGYSLRRLRERARKRRAFDRHADLWDGLEPVLTGLAHGQPLLALPALGGLFAEDQCPDLDASTLGNRALLEAVAKLGWMRSGGSLARINWRDMGPEELGSVYESLLELVPDISADGRVFRFANADESKGNARKTSGSYYTPDSLVQELLDSALEPVIQQRISGATDPESALLSITVCDPACGSGHFLLGAARRLATRLAQLRAQGTPSGEDFRHALRDVITHCIFGVDRNPMAIELARMSLWLEAMTPDRPLGFLDHHLQCGDALLGLTDLAALEQGIPKDAFKALSGDDKESCKALAKQNAAELKDLQRKRTAQAFGQRDLLSLRSGGMDKLRALEALPDDTLEQIAAKQAAWQAFAQESADSPLRHAADMLLAAFLQPKAEANQDAVPTTGTVVLELLGEHDAPGHACKRETASAACIEARVLHWPLAFPLVHAVGGFTCVLGNPPWERIKLQEEEFFASRNRDVAEARNKAERSQRIQWLSEGMLAMHLEPEAGHSQVQAQAEKRLYAEFIGARRTAEVASVFAHIEGKDGGRYPLTGVGDVNTYALFAETISQITAEAGRAGFIVPTGIATDDSTKAFFSHLTQSSSLVSLLAFENEEFIFPAVHHAFRFCMLTLGRSEHAKFVFFARQPHQVHDPRRHFALTPDEFRLINPNTLTCPVFRSERDAELTKKLYRAATVLIDENRTDGNPWGINFMTMFHMSGDSHLFVDTPRERSVPLYEAKLIHQFDHRWATYSDDSNSRVVTAAERADPKFLVTPRYWVDEREVAKRLAEKEWSHRWVMGWRDVTGAEKIRTMIADVMPWSGVGHTLPLFMTDHSPRHAAALLANFDSLALDYVARVKVGGTHLTYGYLKQFPVLPPVRYTEVDLNFIVPRVLEMTYTANDLKAWAQDLGHDGEPFIFDPERRAILRAELDAYYARLYGLTRDELRYILDPSHVLGEDYPSETFRVLKKSELREFGEYRTRNLVLRELDRMTLAEANCEPYASLLNPPPGQHATPAYSSHGIIRNEVDARLVGLLLAMIRQHGRLPRRQLADAVTMAAEPSVLIRLVDVQDAAFVAEFQAKHLGIFDAGRTAGDRIQNWLRHYESIGAIRTDATQLLAIQGAALPDEVIVDEDVVRVADILTSAAAQASLGTPAIDGDEFTDTSAKQA